jgi:hypothetical protein
MSKNILIATILAFFTLSIWESSNNSRKWEIALKALTAQHVKYQKDIATLKTENDFIFKEYNAMQGKLLTCNKNLEDAQFSAKVCPTNCGTLDCRKVEATAEAYRMYKEGVEHLIARMHATLKEQEK